jgi:hypothetical protein
MNTFGIDWGSPDTWRGLIRIIQAVMMVAGIEYQFTGEQIVVIVAVGQAINGVLGLFFTAKEAERKQLEKPTPPSRQF